MKLEFTVSNLATLKPIRTGDGRGGRVPGQVNKVTRVLKTAIVLAGEKSRHSKDGSLLSYLIHVADEYPALYIGLLGRLVPVEAKLKTDFERPQRLTSDMSLNEMVTQFELKIKNEDYQPPPPVIEHNNDGDDDDDESS
jgi:hypothetical protein